MSLNNRIGWMLFSLSMSLQLIAQEFKPVKFPSHYVAQLDVVYVSQGAWEGRMDVYFQPKAEQPTPIILNIHGGGWNHGEKESQTGFAGFFKKGFAVANIEYRLSDVASAPAAIVDVRCALIYLLTHAEDLNIDREKVYIMGGSAGGHLALMAGLMGNNRHFDGDCSYEGEIKVAAIIDKYGPTDLVPLSQKGSVKRWLGEQSKDLAFVESVSPVYQVDSNSPAVLILHGTADATVSIEHSEKLYALLKENGVRTEFIRIEGGGHGGFSKEEMDAIKSKMWLFLEELQLEDQALSERQGE